MAKKRKLTSGREEDLGKANLSEEKIAERKEKEIDGEPLSLDDLEGVSGGETGGGVLNFGSFQSNTGTSLNILVDWCVVSGNAGEKKLEVEVFSRSYSLQSIELLNGVSLIVDGGLPLNENSAAVNYSGRKEALFPLASFSVPYLSGTVQLRVIWHFNGSYSGVPISEITASGTAFV